MSKTVATYLSKEIEEDYQTLCTECKSEKPSDVLRYAIKKAAGTKAQEKKEDTENLGDFEKKIAEMPLSELEKLYAKISDQDKKSVRDKKNMAWHYDRFFHDMKDLIDHRAPVLEFIDRGVLYHKISLIAMELAKRRNIKLKTWDDIHRQASMVWPDDYKAKKEAANEFKFGTTVRESYR